MQFSKGIRYFARLINKRRRNPQDLANMNLEDLYAFVLSNLIFLRWDEFATVHPILATAQKQLQINS